MKLKSKLPSPALMACREDVMRVLKKHSANLSAQEILAIMAHALGQTLALQDQRVPAEKYLAMIGTNIEIGNAEVVNSLGMGKTFNDLPV